METEEILKGKKILIVDDEKDILAVLEDLLEMCKVDKASTFEEAEDYLEKESYDVVILDIMGVNGYELLKIATKKGIPALMLTGHALTKQDMKRSFKEGAVYYVPKEELNKILEFLGDILEAKGKREKITVRWYERLSPYFNRKFGPDWKNEDPQFWDSLLKY